MALDIPSLGLQVGGSAAVGGIIGFAAKKIAKVIAAIVGAELVLFKFLESQGFIAVNWERLGGAFQGLARDAPLQTQSIVDTLVATAGVGGGFAGGFLLGFKRA